MGRLQLWENIAFLNVHTGQKNIISTSFNVLVRWDFPASDFWIEDCNGKAEFAAMDKFRHIPHDKCAGYTLAPALGGKQSAANMQLFDCKAHLEVLAQLL